ncbi:MAG: cytochrome c-type biogenesis protein CcmH, partial [Gammaproteobacteria bacterium]|nr:cytochrome c-type biogenesis protein CcmH [Gammaproteobacteria bacterium]NIR67834.1 cytochrome c-type biogenesis protein CcmH [candidate division Zixibacteria bacterium]NIR95311.1 cytochrome c-type biogenesis protein CcmH [Gammaproteobacteria bacterium]NIS49059.1 cytochrome c-type biogenesis protein CcmH [candidate division Zixibacteria bacterium]NIU17145.1 cytochrome c-type biogenesis protein CcmH [candidate division Zixibacteria bacterium]
QNLADSNAELARTLRETTYSMILEGKTNKEIIQYMVDRYGDFVLYRPRVTGRTIILWAGPFVLLLLALSVLFSVIRRNRVHQIELDDRDLSQTRVLLNDSKYEDE